MSFHYILNPPPPRNCRMLSHVHFAVSVQQITASLYTCGCLIKCQSEDLSLESLLSVILSKEDIMFSCLIKQKYLYFF